MWPYMGLPFGALFSEFGILIGGFSSQTETPIINWVYFGRNAFNLGKICLVLKQSWYIDQVVLWYNV